MLSNTGSTSYVSPADNRCHFVLLDNDEEEDDESYPTADQSNIGRPNGQTY